MSMTIDISRLREALAERGLTQAELARRSSVSRATLAKLLNGKATRVHSRTGQRIASALGLPEHALDANGIETSYLSKLAEQHQYLDFTGMGVVSAGEPMLLDRGYVPITVRERDKHLAERKSVETCGRPATLPRNRLPSFLLETALLRSRRFFLLGEPGAGKTTSLRYLARKHAMPAKSHPPDVDRQWLPILVRLAEWSQQLHEDETVDVIHAALAQLSVPNPAATAEWLKERACRGDVLLLLDGLDEVAEPGLQAALIERIREFVREHREAHVVITSRPVGFQRPNLGATFDALWVQPLSEEAIRTFVAEWPSTGDGHDTGRKYVICANGVQQLGDVIIDHPRIRALAANPMMLTVLCLLHESGASLPQRRCQLYEKIVEAFLFSWEQKKRAAMSGAPDRCVTLEEREIKWLLESLALDMQRKDMTLAPRWWLSEKSTSFLRDELGLGGDKAHQMSDTLLWSLQERAGVLAERSPELYGFRHLAFQEYFAARAILAEDDPIQSLRPYLYHPRWREVVRLVSAQLDRRRAPQLLRLILDDPDPTGRLLRRGLLTALGCLSDGTPVHDSDVLGQVERAAVQTAGTEWFHITTDTIGLLGELNGTRLEGFARNTIDKIIQRARENPAPICYFMICTEAFLGGFVMESTEERHERDEVQRSSPEPVFAIEIAHTGLALSISLRPDAFDVDWANRVLQQLRSDCSPATRARCAEELGQFAKANKKARKGLLDAMSKESTPSVRRAIAYALRFACGVRDVQRVLLTHLEDDREDNAVRGACARSLRSLTRRDEGVRAKLMGYLAGDSAVEIRVGAVEGLAGCARLDTDVRDTLWALVKKEDEDASVRIASLHALEDLIPSVSDGVSIVAGLLTGGPDTRLAGVAAQVLAGYAATGRAEWGRLPIERIEQVLVSLKAPCQHALDALRALVDAREVRRLGIPREARIKRALSAYEDRIHVMFVFGSAARREQGPDSDIDLMVIGDVSLRELTPGLKQAEVELGRQVSAVVYTQDEWERRVQEKTPFIEGVLNAEQVFVIGERDDLAAVARR